MCNTILAVAQKLRPYRMTGRHGLAEDGRHWVLCSAVARRQQRRNVFFRDGGEKKQKTRTAQSVWRRYRFLHQIPTT